MEIGDAVGATPTEQLIGRLLPAPVRVVESFCDRHVTLFPEEAAYVRNAVPQRRAEFATARAHARQALGLLGLSPVPLVPGDRGQPCWPDGVIGSMTHCGGYRAVAVALAGDVAAIGIDAEVNDRLPDGVLQLVAGPAERKGLMELPAEGLCRWDRLLFCAKESVYKAWYPITHEWLDFHDVTVRISVDGTFAAHLHKAGAVVDGRPVTQFLGRWIVIRSFVATAIAIPRRSLRSRVVRPR
jgi:enterobactin synthetase component D / holo-[acyl-carrier protein] synthase